MTPDYEQGFKEGAQAIVDAINASGKPGPYTLSFDAEAVRETLTIAKGSEQ